jgi:hypothetical protein
MLVFFWFGILGMRKFKMLVFWFLLGFGLLVAGAFGLVVYLLLFCRWGFDYSPHLIANVEGRYVKYEE